MSNLQWRNTSAQELAQLLGRAQVLESSAVGTSTVYRLDLQGQEQIAVALPDGKVLVIAPTVYVNANRRKRPEPDTPK